MAMKQSKIYKKIPIEYWTGGEKEYEKFLFIMNLLIFCLVPVALVMFSPSRVRNSFFY